MNTAKTQLIPAGKFGWLLKREFWEHRGGFLWAPVITGSIVVVLYGLLAVIGSIAGRKSGGGFNLDESPQKIHEVVGAFGDGVLLAGILLACVVLAFVVFFYSLGALYDDRRDRSVLFWKSLPLSDSQTVLSKAAWALLLAPLLALGVGLAIGLAMWLITALTMTVNGLPAGAAVFTHSHPLRVVGGAIAALPVYIAWALPTVGWLMFCSAWSRTKPFLWAVLIPILACVIVSMMDILPPMHIRHDVLWYVVVFRGLLSVAPGTWYAAINGGHGNREINTPDELANAIDLRDSWQAFGTYDLWIGVVIGVVLIAGAIYMRRWRDDN
ncbi:MAG TPA: ABC transporter permease [Stenotrophomonas sp.]|nr:ABC transporter permease [Stenotrophomonas sp.]